MNFCNISIYIFCKLHAKLCCCQYSYQRYSSLGYGAPSSPKVVEPVQPQQTYAQAPSSGHSGGNAYEPAPHYWNGGSPDNARATRPPPTYRVSV